ncbi:YihY/virulence factor BrkB family protein [Pontixanthobacter sp.]|uniref:YihY/virulence factor BrkB family protein n=1 Tax=Pontixanthobacter sp. TaxID=2792078 RepID=UPI003C79C90B
MISRPSHGAPPKPNDIAGTDSRLEASIGLTEQEVDAIEETQPGATATSPANLPLSAWQQIAKRVWVMAGFHNLSLLAAGTAFFAFLAITPLLAATVMTYGLLGDVETVQNQMETISAIVPPEAAVLIETQLLTVVETSSGVTGVTLVISLIFALYGAMRAASGLIGALNIINSEHESRNMFSVALRAAGMTLAAIMIALTGLVSGGLVAWLQTQTSPLIGPFADDLYQLITWAVAMLLGSSGFALIMKYGPDRRAAKWRWLSPGSILATFTWVAISFGFSLYVRYVSDYSATYGSLSAVVVFLMWLFLTCYAILIGALLNAEIERQTLIDTTVGIDRPLGERGAVMADSAVSIAPDSEILDKKRRRQAAREARKAASH